MRLLKPSWVTLDDKPIFSIDIHPDGSRFATGGQGDDCGKVVIWNMAPVRDEISEKNDAVPKILCQMDNHLGCVNCVRWSHNGRHLASGADDKLVMIWQTSRYGGPSTVFGSGGKMVNIEQWRPVFTLRGHSGDVLDLAWSPHDAWLATCSVDNTVVVWNAVKFPEQICVLKGHSGLVKGVTWDPVGKYLASQSDDKTLRIWRTVDWQQEAVVKEPFEECSATTHILRLNWSPDGHYIVSAHAMNNSGPTAQIIERDGWRTSMDFVGHRKAITVVRFNPNILSMKVKKELDKPQQYTCCAIGSRDRSLSIWLTALKRPLVVTHDLFTNSILDIHGNKCGMELLCCSWDGTIAFIDFTAEEIGRPLSIQEVSSIHERIYGKSLALANINNSGSQIIESGALLNLARQQEAREAAHRAAVRANRLLVNGKTPFKPTDKQIETRTADGRRRITPIYLAPQPDMSQGCDNGEMMMPFDSQNCSNSEPRKITVDTSSSDLPAPYSDKNITFTSSTEQSRIVIERQDRVTGPGLNQSAVKTESDQSSSAPTSVALAGSCIPQVKAGSPVPDSEAPNTPASGNDGDNPAATNGTPSTQPITALGANRIPLKVKDKFNEKIPAKVKAVMEREMEKKKLFPGDRLTSSSSCLEEKKNRLKSTLPVKRKFEGGGRVGRPRKYPLLNSASSQSPNSPAGKEELGHRLSTDTDLHLPSITIQKSFSKQIGGRLSDHNTTVIEVDNSIHFGPTTVHRVRLQRGGTSCWEQLLPSRAVCVAGSSHVACVACEDCSITFFSTGGRKMFPSLILNSRVSVLDCNGPYVMAITQKGRLYVWNLSQKCSVISNENLNIIMNEMDLIEKAQISQKGIPIISLSNNRTYTFSSEFGSWVWITSKVDPLQRHSDHYNCTPAFETISSDGALSSLQSTQERSGTQAARMYQSSMPSSSGSSGANVQQCATLTHLCNQLAACLALQSGSEYRFWLLTYVRYLAQEGIEPRLREICEDLLGLSYTRNRKGKWESYILGLKKRDLLEEILPIIGSNLRFQRFYTEYQDQLLSLSDE
ncbi:protein HIRA [Octopus sinensis]|uniref:Protein HIRA n=1 Tax=Octopus sinensis TaxID=2607531 RepID=A0A6P7TH70_9MOLL|nr:protein HIRA [Octopus sinensis]